MISLKLNTNIGISGISPIIFYSTALRRGICASPSVHQTWGTSSQTATVATSKTACSNVPEENSRNLLPEFTLYDIKLAGKMHTKSMQRISPCWHTSVLSTDCGQSDEDDGKCKLGLPVRWYSNGKRPSSLRPVHILRLGVV